MKYQEILEAAVRAPSGDNCQPWRFEIDDNRILVFNVPERDTSVFNYHQRASFVALGALLENLIIAAKANGYSPSVDVFPDGAGSDLFAAVVLTPAPVSSEPVYPFIAERCTNRRLYDGYPLSDSDRDVLIKASEGFAGIRLALFEAAQRNTVADVIAVNDRIVFENQALHKFLFDHVRWSYKEAVATRDGLDIRTLELKFPDNLAFPLLAKWPLVDLLNGLGLSRIIAGNARKLACSAGAVGVIFADGCDRNSYTRTGRTMERIWLEATRKGLAFQLMTGITFLMQQVEEGQVNELCRKHVELVRSARQKIASISGDSGVPIIIFRVGKAAQPSVMSMRREI